MNKKTCFFVLLLNLLCILSSNAQETSDDLYEKVTSVEENERYHLIAECDGKFYCAQNVLKSASLGSDEITKWAVSLWSIRKKWVRIYKKGRGI